MTRTTPSVRTLLRGFVGFSALACAAAADAQPIAHSPLSPPANGVRRADSTWHAITNATVHPRPGETLEKTTIVIRDGRIVAVGPTDETATEGCQLWDASGLHVYAGFIDPYVEVEAPQPDAGGPGVHWNSRVTPQRSALESAGISSANADALRKLGFTSAAIAPGGGIFRGASAVVSLADPISDLSADRPPVYREHAYQVVALSGGGFRGGGTPGQRPDSTDYSRWPSYPGSQMGAIALIRQTFIDAGWQTEARKAGASIAPNAIDHLTQGAPLFVFDTSDELEALRCAKIAKEFALDAVILGCGTEFRRLEAIAADKPPIILPLDYPRTPDVSGVGKADNVELAELMAWEQAPTNPRRLDAAGLEVSLTTSKLRSRTDFTENLNKAIKHGLAPDRALAMLTTNPAGLLGVSDSLGTIEPGKIANLVVSESDLFDAWGAQKEDAKDAGEAAKDGEAKPEDRPEAKPEDHPEDRREGEEAAKQEGDGREARDASRSRRAKIRDVWIDGQRHEINAAQDKSAAGTWAYTELDGEARETTGPEAITFVITEQNSITYSHKGKTARATSVRILDNRVEYALDAELFGIKAVLMDSAVIEGDEMHGFTPLPDGSIHRWSANRLSRETSLPRDDDRAERRGRGDRAEAENSPKPAPAGDQPQTAQAPTPNPAPDMHELAPADKDARIAALIEQARKQQGEKKYDEAKKSVDELLALDPQNPTGLLLRDLYSDVLSYTGNPELGRTQQPDARTDRDDSRSREPRKSPEALEREAIAAIPEELGYPFGPYMRDAIPPQKNIVFTNATIWTAGPEGTIENGALYISGGMIEFVGTSSEWEKWLENKRLAGLETVDCEGKHIAPGIIDCHSHTGISRGVNEGGQAVTAEVRIGDVTDPDAISWYRQLAAGVTAVNSLHGSANAIGGQNQVNKIRWGVPHPDQMHFEGAKPGIKFALGENPKGSNSDRNTTRYPQTRMGVEMLIRDRFTAAREYAEAMGISGDLEPITGSGFVNGDPAIAPSIPVRRDLELEALAEILAGERLVHCHSYRQDEILMLCRVAGDFGFKIGTFQHILEGYKVADEIAKAALGASGFSDWWAYKVEVQDAIPQGGPIMHEQGVVVSYNSDSDELARRLNTEAGKAVKYGGLAPEEAIKFVTLNPAKQLAVAERVGSLEVGKDADLAVWSTTPISSMARCEATYIDGREYFSLEQDKEHRERIQKERHRLIQKVLALGSRGGSRPESGGAGFGGRRRPTDDHTRAGMLEQYYLDLINRGGDPSAARPGECGCGLMH